MLTIKALRKALLFGSTALLMMSLVACGGDSSGSTDASKDGGADSQTSAKDDSSGEGPKYIYLTNTPIGVNKFLESGKIGVEAAAEKFNGTSKVFEAQDDTSMRQNMDAAIAENPDVIVAITFDYTEITKEAAKANPEQTFVLIDDCTDDKPDNMYCAVFREHEAAYLLGYEAGLMTKTNKTGSVGAVDIPFLHRYTDAFAQGSKDANPKSEDNQLFIGGNNPFLDPAKGKEQAAAIIAGGTDQILAGASGSNGGIFEAAADAGNVTAYGVDVNQCPDQPGAVGDGTLKLMDILIPDLISKIKEGKAEPVASYGLKEGGMDIVSLHKGAEDSQCTVMEHPDVVKKLGEIRDGIISGDIKPVDATKVNN